MRYLCLITHTTYGESGNELHPPVQDSKTYVEMSTDGETRENFSIRMAGLVLPIRRDAISKPVRPYSVHDGWDWTIHDVKPLAGRMSDAR